MKRDTSQIRLKINVKHENTLLLPSINQIPSERAGNITYLLPALNKSVILIKPSPPARHLSFVELPTGTTPQIYLLPEKEENTLSLSSLLKL